MSTGLLELPTVTAKVTIDLAHTQVELERVQTSLGLARLKIIELELELAEYRARYGELDDVVELDWPQELRR